MGLENHLLSFTQYSAPIDCMDSDWMLSSHNVSDVGMELDYILHIQ